MREKINDDLKTAMKAGEKDRVGTLRLVNAAHQVGRHRRRPSGQGQDHDADILAVLAKMIKQRRDSIEQFYGRRAPGARRQGSRPRSPSSRPTCPSR